MILIKPVLSAQPLFQSYLLLSPKTISAQTVKLLRDFLWKGGKGNQNKMHLESWQIIKRPLSIGGLQICHPYLANLALGGKLI